jgi:(1->4)-alpha-D-glucan 1-alpha-D-glucosylmutase
MPPRKGDGAVIPRATYRLQLHGGFTFDAAAAVVPYLAQLGISHVYCSPILRARPGSQHGYDVIAHDQINPELGGAAGFERLLAALRAHGMGAILDLVPNHMGVSGGANRWWADVLEHGPASVFATYFDIDWEPVNQDLHGKVLTPVLGEHYSDVLDGGQLQLRFDAAAGAVALHYHEHVYPLDLRTLAPLFAAAASNTHEAQAHAGLERLAAAMEALPLRMPAAAGSRASASAALRRALAELVARDPAAAAAISAALDAANGPDERDRLHGLLEAQAYRLTFWRVAADEINYRRFFDINELAGLRMEDPAVFEATHALSLDLAAAGTVDGFRIDHPDGLYDPAAYFERLQQGYRARLAPAPGGGATLPLYVVAEKIAAPYEDVPIEWQLHGTTGYRFAMVVGGVLVDTTAEAEIDRIWHQFSGRPESFAQLAYDARKRAARGALASDLTMHATALWRIARADRRTRDFSYNSLRDALAEVAACMPVYRTYVMDRPSTQDERFVDWAIAHARRHSDNTDPSIFDFVRRCMLNEPLEGYDDGLRLGVREFARRFQQFCAPVAAKGVEDTAFYRYHRLVSLNEVGGDPGTFGVTLRAFHGASADRAERWPHTILATSTHDNKRSEDVRNRIGVLSERPAEWEAWLARWSALAEGWRGRADGEPAPSRADEYLLYQTLLGSLPAGEMDTAALADYRDRIQAYMLKAAREAKLSTSWMRPNADYEKALAGVIDALLGRLQPNPLLTDLRQRAADLAWFGALNSLTMVLLKFTSPGVPDIYQGNEAADLSLVDPDNRRPVDYAVRRASLDAWTASHGDALPFAADALGEALSSGRLKLWATWRLLQLRKAHELLFRNGRYASLDLTGARAEHAVAYTRSAGDSGVYVVGARLYASLSLEPGTWPVGVAVWQDTALMLPAPAEDVTLRDLITGERLRAASGRVELAQAFALLPIAVLMRE